MPRHWEEPFGLIRRTVNLPEVEVEVQARFCVSWMHRSSPKPERVEHRVRNMVLEHAMFE